MASQFVQKFITSHGSVVSATREQVEACPAWRAAFADHRQDHRYYRIVEDTIREGFEYRYLVIEDAAGTARAVQPYFLVDQDLLGGAAASLRGVVAPLRRLYPRLFHMRTMMVGCAAGEGHLDGDHNGKATWVAACLHGALRRCARSHGASLIVMKEFGSAYRGAMACMSNDGYARLPSFPMTRLRIDGYEDFESYVSGLSRNARKSLRRNLRRAEAGGPIEMQVVDDVTPWIDEVYPLYLQVFERAALRFEKLTKAYMCRLGREMPEQVRFFIWRREGRAIAFALTMVKGDTLHDLYLGMDYPLALELHLYFYTFRDVLKWAMGEGLRWYCSTSLGYDPKLRLGCELAPLDLYVRHRSSVANFFMKRILPWLEPTRHEKSLRGFSNYHELWGDDVGR
ncbi:MAG TPA: GNAT family N-acetyltransferase [Tepidisphaeraceae bacterium]|jgi:predicted N-acyltransferase